MKFLSLPSALWVAGLFALVQSSNVVELSPDNWDSVVGKGKSGLVEFYAPWCGHCKNLAPVYEQLADAYAHAKEKVYIAKIDADGVGKELGAKYGVTGFPTLKWFGADGKDEPFEGQRDLDSLAAFVTKKSSVKSSIKPPPPSTVTVLDVHTFDDLVLSNDNNVLVSFTAPWCGHCKNLKPIYEKVANTFQHETGCIVANVDADDKKNKDLSSRYGVTGYPTLKFFSKDSKEAVTYEGGRSEEDLVKFLNEKCGTQRAVGGGLNDEAGRLTEFDALASKFFVATGDARDAIFKEATLLGATAKDSSKHYLRVMEKIVNGTENYIAKEAKRLESILKKQSLSALKLDEIKVKANILRAFGEKKPVDEDSESTVRKATAEL